jgi:hypothetical protein
MPFYLVFLLACCCAVDAFAQPLEYNKYTPIPATAPQRTTNLARYCKTGTTRYGFSHKGQQLVPPIYEDAGVFSEGLVTVRRNGKYGFVDTTGAVVIPFEYDFAWGFEQGLAAVRQAGNVGFIDKMGEVVIPFQYDAVNESYLDQHLVPRNLPRKNKNYWSVPFVDEILTRATFRNAVTAAGNWYHLQCDWPPIPKHLTHRRVDPYRTHLSQGAVRLEKKGKYGFVDTQGEEIIPFVYDHVWNFSEGLAGVQQAGKAGFVDKTGKVAIAFDYDYVWPFSDGLALVRLKGKYGFIDKTGQVIIPINYPVATSFVQGVAILFDGATYELVNTEGRSVNGERYDFLAVDNAHHLVFVQDGKLGLLDYRGKELLPAVYKARDPQRTPALYHTETAIHYVNERGLRIDKAVADKGFTFKRQVDGGFLIVQIGGKTGLLDNNLQVVIPFFYDHIGYYKGIFFLSKYGQISLWTPEHRYSSPFSYDNISVSSDSLLIARQGAHSVLLDRRGNRLLKLPYPTVHPFLEGFAVVKKENRCGLINRWGTLVLPMDYKDICYSGGNCVQLTTLEGKLGLADTTGAFLLPPVYDKLQLVLGGLGRIEKDNLTGFVNDQGKVVIPLQYRYASDFVEGHAIVLNNYIPDSSDLVPDYSTIIQEPPKRSQYGVIDQQHNIVLPFEYDHLTVVDRHLVAARKEAVSHLIDLRTGQQLSQPYSYIGALVEGRIKVSRGGLYGFIDRQGQEIIPCKYRTIGNFEDGLAKVSDVNNANYIDAYGRELISNTPAQEKITPYTLPQLFMGNFYSNVTWFVKNGKMGWINRYGQILIPSRLERLHPASGANLLVGILGSKQDSIVLFTPMGKVVSKLGSAPRNSSNLHFSEGLAMLVFEVEGEDDYRNGYLSEQGKLAIPAIYNEAQNFLDGRALVRYKNKWFSINKKGRRLKKVSYNQRRAAKYGGYWLSYQDYNLHFSYAKIKHGLANAKNRVIIPVEYDNLRGFGSRYLIAKKGNLFGLFTTQGKKALPLEYSNIQATGDGVALLYKDGKIGWVDSTGYVVAPTYECQDRALRSQQFPFMVVHGKKRVQFINYHLHSIVNTDYIEAYFNRNFLQVTKDGKHWGLVNRYQRELTPLVYDKVSDFWANGLAIVQQNSQYGLIDTNAVEVVPCQYDYLDWSEDRHTQKTCYSARKNKKQGYLDAQGKVLVPVEYDHIEHWNKGEANTEKAGLVGRVSVTRGVLAPAIYDTLIPKAGYVLAQKAGKYGLLNHKYQPLLAFEYDSIYPIQQKNFIVRQYFALQQDSLYAVADSQGKLLTPFAYQAIDNQLINERLLVKKGNRYGYLDASFTLLPTLFDRAGRYTGNGHATVQQDSKIFDIDLQGNYLYDCPNCHLPKLD